MSNDSTKTYKVLLLGNSFVGKSSMLIRFVDNIFQDEYEVTIGLNYRIKQVQLANGETVLVQVWDTFGQEKFNSIAKNFYRGANGILLIYDITERKSFDDIKHWVEQITENTGNEKIVKYLVGNKSDKEKDRAVTRSEGQNLAKEFNIKYFECSAKLGDSINDIFTQLANDINTDVKIISKKGKTLGGNSTASDKCKCS